MPWALGSKQTWSRSFKWGTKLWFWSRGCKNTRGQSWSLEKISAERPGSNPCASGQPRWQIFFSKLQLWPLVFLQPLDQNQCLVPHLKDLFYICLETKAQGFGMTFNVFNLGSKYPYFNRAYVVSSGFGCTHLYHIPAKHSRTTFSNFHLSRSTILTLMLICFGNLSKILRNENNFRFLKNLFL